MLKKARGTTDTSFCVKSFLSHLHNALHFIWSPWCSARNSNIIPRNINTNGSSFLCSVSRVICLVPKTPFFPWGLNVKHCGFPVMEFFRNITPINTKSSLVHDTWKTHCFMTVHVTLACIIWKKKFLNLYQHTAAHPLNGTQHNFFSCS